MMLLHKPEVLEGKSCPLIPQISRKPTRVSAVRGRRVTALDMARPESSQECKNYNSYRTLITESAVFRYVIAVYLKTWKIQLNTIFEQILGFIEC